MLVTLPSGAVAPLEVPSLPSLLAAGGDLVAIAATSCDDTVAVGRLEADDLYAVAEWSLLSVAGSPDGAELAIVCAAFGITPSRYVGLREPVLAFRFDQCCLDALGEARSGDDGTANTEDDDA